MEMLVLDPSHKNDHNTLPSNVVGGDKSRVAPVTQWSTPDLLNSLLRGQQTLLQITKIVVQAPPLSDETLREIENVVTILHKRQQILIAELKDRDAL